MQTKALVPIETIEQKILLIRGQKIMLDRDLAKLYGVETRVLNQAVRRNIKRFPDDFLLSLSREEIMNLSQIVISSNIKHAPNVYAFTEQGIAMLSGVLNSERAIEVNPVRKDVALNHALSTRISKLIILSQPFVAGLSNGVNIQIMRAFVRLREMFATNKEFAHKLAELERKVGSHDEAIRSLVIAIKDLLVQPEPKHRRIGFL